jgi:predicted DNA-binding protein YlxM (UPF0122 family)
VIKDKFHQSNKEKLELWNTGNYTLQEIADKFDVSRERIRQILKKYKASEFFVLDVKERQKLRREDREYFKEILKKPHRDKIYDQILETKSQQDDDRREAILRMRAEDKSLDEIGKELNISKIRTAQIIRDMKDEGIDVPNSRNTGVPLTEKEIKKRVDLIDAYIDDELSIKQIAKAMKIQHQTISRLIYLHLIKNND